MPALECLGWEGRPSGRHALNPPTHTPREMTGPGDDGVWDLT